MARILVIEDEAPIRENLLRFLRLEGHDVVAAENGRIGLEMAAAHSPELIFCDVMMPEMNGVAVLDAIRNDAVLAETCFIFLTASADAEDVQRGLNRGANEYVTKPFNLKDLRAVIARHLGESKA